MVTRAVASSDEVWRILSGVMDPEVPVLSVVELGIVRDVAVEGDGIAITITPTYSGCPAMAVIEQDIRAALAAQGITEVALRTVYAPAWTTDWMSVAAHEKLREFGIAPPSAMVEEEVELVTLTRRRVPVPCPYCGSTNTELMSEFGSTACKAIHACRACRQPFEEFKAL